MGTNLEDFIKEKRKTTPTSSTVQPYLICVEGEVKKYFIIVDNVILSRKNQGDVISSFDLLFKVYYVSNVEYPVLLQNLYNFIESYIYEITDRKALGVVTSLYINLKNIDLSGADLNVEEMNDSD